MRLKKKTKTPYTVRIFRDYIEITALTPGILKEGISEEEISNAEIPETGIEIAAESINIMEAPAAKPKASAKKEKKRKPRKTREKQLTIKDAVLVGSGQLPGNKSAQEVYEKERSFYLRKGTGKSLIPAISKVKYARILASLRKLPTLPAEYKIVKNALRMEPDKLTEQEFNRWVLVALAKVDIIIETEDEKTMVKLKE